VVSTPNHDVNNQDEGESKEYLKYRSFYENHVSCKRENLLSLAIDEDN